MQLSNRGGDATNMTDFREEMAEEVTSYTVACWIHAYSGPDAPPPKHID